MFTVTLSKVNNTGAAITFNLADLATGSATSGADYTAIPGGTLITIANGANTGSYTVTVTDDALLEATETLNAQIAASSNPAVAITGATATANIVDNDTANAVLSTTNGTEGTTDVVFTVTLSKVNNTGAAITFNLADLATGSATSGADYTAIPGGTLITIANGANTGSYTVTVTDDALLEATETLNAQIAASSNPAVAITGATATANIVDNDTANAVLSATNGTEGATDVVFTVTLSKVNNTGAAITFNLADLATGSATSGADYTAIPGGTLITIANGANTGSYTVTVTDDALLEATETLNAQIAASSNPAVAITGATATANIVDNDTANAVLSATNGTEGATDVVVHRDAVQGEQHRRGHHLQPGRSGHRQRHLGRRLHRHPGRDPDHDRQRRLHRLLHRHRHRRCAAGGHRDAQRPDRGLEQPRGGDHRGHRHRQHCR